MTVRRYAVELVRTSTGNGGDEWRLEVNRSVVGGVGYFTEDNLSPDEALPKVLRKIMVNEEMKKATGT